MRYLTKTVILFLTVSLFLGSSVFAAQFDDYTEKTAPANNDVMIIKDTNGAATKKVTLGNALAGNIICTDNEATNENNVIPFVADADADGDTTNGVKLESDGDFTYNPSTGTVTATEFVGGGTGLTGIPTASSTITDNAIVRGDGGATGIQSSSITIDDDGKTTETVTLDDATGDEVAHTINYTVNKASSGNDTGLLVLLCRFV